MSFNPFEQLHFVWQYRNKVKEVKELDIIGYDTETQGGLCKLIASPLDYCHPSGFDDILGFLTSKRRRGKIGFFFNLRYDFQSILKWLPPSDWKAIAEKNRINYGDYEVSYIPKKHLGIRRFYGAERGSKRRARVFHFYDICQFYKMSLDNAAKKYLGKEKQDVSAFDLANLQDADFLNPTFIKYCMKDAQLAEELARFWIDLCQSQGLFPSTFYSTGSIGERYFLKECKIPTINRFLKSERNKRLLSMAWLACRGAQVTVYKRGRFKTSFTYDINSAYPHVLSGLPNIDCGRFFVRFGDPPDSAIMGWLKVKVEIEPDSPGAYNPPFVLNKGNVNYSPMGTFITYITLNEYRVLSKDFKIEPYNGLYWVPFQDIEYPFRDVVHRIYTLRQTIDKKKDFAVNYFWKTILNSYYGKTLQRILVKDPNDPLYGKRKTGRVFNPFYTSYILADTRLSIYQALKRVDVRKDLVACFTDSIILKREYRELDQGPGLGNWVLENVGDLVLLSTGIYTLRKRGGGLKTKTRGLHTTSSVDFFKIIKEQAKETFINMSQLTPLTLKQSLTQRREIDMNVLENKLRHIEMNSDTKRLWSGEFKRVGEALTKRLDSAPFYLT